MAVAKPDASPPDPRCGEPCRFLTDTRLADLATTYQAACGAAADVLDDCDKIDYARNCVYAAHDATFTKRKWKAAFGGKPWYHADPAVAANTLALNDTETENMKALVARRNACKASSIKAYDLEVVRDWFRKPPKEPKVDFEGTLVDARQFKAALGKAAKPIFAAALSGKGVTTEYVNPPLVKRTLESASTDVGEVMVTIRVPGQDPPGVFVELVFDLDDTCVGAAAQRMMEEDFDDRP